MSVWLAMLIGAGIGIIITTLILSNTRNGRIKAEYEQYIAELELEHQQALTQAQKRSVNTSRAVLKGKMAEQFAPVLPEFQYLPSDAKFMGDPVDYIIFDGYTDFRDGDGTAEDINIILLAIFNSKSAPRIYFNIWQIFCGLLDHLDTLFNSK